MTLANWITLFRILLTPFFFVTLIYYVPGKEYYRLTAFTLLLIASLTDALDGFLARITKTKTVLGQFLDPLADKLLLLCGFLGVAFVEALPYRPPLWVTVTIVFRDFIIITGLLLIFVMRGKIHVAPNFLGKATTAFQMITLNAILLKLRIAIPLCYITAGLTILSCLAYTFRDIKTLKA